MAMSNAERQRRYRAQVKADHGWSNFTGIAPVVAHAELMILCRRLMADPTLEIVLRNPQTGRIERL